jgi:predicted alpha/beta-fold hydrolase
MGRPVQREPFDSARGDDGSQLLAHIERACPGTPLLGIGFSMGAIVLNNYLASAGESTPLAAAVSVSGMVNTHESARGFPNEYSRQVWQPFILRATRSGALKLGAELLTARGVDPQKLCRVETARELDEAFSVPYFGYKDYEDFVHHQCIVHPSKYGAISRPLLFINARDDPLFDIDCQHCTELVAGNPHLSFLLTDRGGHCGYASGLQPWRNPWGFPIEAAIAFFEAVLNGDGKREDHAAVKRGRGCQRRATTK